MFTGYYESTTKNALDCARECIHTLMHQSLRSLTISRATPREFLKGRIPPPQQQRKCETPTPGAENSYQNPTLGAIIFKNPAKNKT